MESADINYYPESIEIINNRSDNKILKIEFPNDKWKEKHQINYPFERQAFEGMMFYIKGNTNIALRQHCLLCNKERFTQEEVEKLSDKNLTFESFNNLDFKFAYPLVCCNCRYDNDKAIEILIENCYITHSFQISNYSCYNFSTIWTEEFGIPNCSFKSNKYR